MPKYHVEDSYTIIALYKVILVVEMAQLHLLAAHVAMENSMAIEVDPAIAIKRIQIHAPIEILHLETQKNPSCLTYYNLQ